MSRSTADSEDQDFLDGVLDKALRSLSEHADIDIAELSAPRPELREEVARVVSLAREVALVRPPQLPEVDGYEILHEIGRGGMGVVYAARQLALDREVALKVLPAASLASSTARQRFLREARSLARVRHENVVPIYEVIETAELCAFSMELIRGPRLADFVAQHSSVAGRGTVASCRVALAVARALSVMHEHGLVHRDVKPSNVLLRENGEPVLSDFGLVHDERVALTRSGDFVGTTAFAAPEQLGGSTVGPAADIFGLGATLHCLLANAPPFAGDAPNQQLANIHRDKRKRLTELGVPRDVETIVAKCLESESRERYASAEELAEELTRLLELRPLRARPSGVVRRGVKAVRRNKRLLLAAGGGGVVVLAVMAFLAWFVYDRLTLPGRVADLIRVARFQLLEPSHEERVLLADRRQPPERASVFASSWLAALRSYDSALALNPHDEDLRIERAVVNLGRALIVGDSKVELTAVLRNRCPQTCDTYSSWAMGLAEFVNIEEASRQDRRSLGLLAFLVGRASTCHAAWAGLDLSYDQPDPLIDAAAGQMYLARGDPAKALPRLDRGLRAWPDAGFLAVAIADGAVRLGDLSLARNYLEVAQSLEHKDSFSTHKRVRADLLSLDDKPAEAREIYEWVLRHHRGVTARVHYSRLLEREGDLARAVELYLWLVENEPDASKYMDRFRVLAAKWWDSMSMVRLAATFVRRHTQRRWQASCRALPALIRTLSEDSSTPQRGSSSRQSHRALLEGNPYTMELMTMRISERFPDNALTRLTGTFLTGVCLGLDRLRRHRKPSSRVNCSWVQPGARAVLWISAILAGAASGQVQWKRLPTSSNPPARRYAASAFDEARGVFLLYGGVLAGATNPRAGDFWALRGSKWTQLMRNATPGTRGACAMCYIGGGRTLLFGGYRGTTPLGDTWLWDGTRWKQLTFPPNARPSPRWRVGLAFDSSRGKAVLFGGGALQGTKPIKLGDTWEFDAKTLKWGLVHRGGAGAPSSRDTHAFAYDRARKHVLLFGGIVGKAANAETWTWNGKAWRRHNVKGPAARYRAGITYDAVRCCVLLHGGLNSTGALGDVWEWTGAAWQQRTPPTAPAARHGHALGYDTVAKASVCFGGASPKVTGMFSGTWLYGPTAHASFDAFGQSCGRAKLEADCSLPWIGHSFSMRASPVPAGSVRLLLFGSQRLNVKIGSCSLLVAPVFIWPQISFSTTAQWSLPVPNDSKLITGKPLFLNQVLVFKQQGAGFVFSESTNAATAIVGTR